MDDQYFLGLTEEELFGLYISNSASIERLNEIGKELRNKLNWSDEEKEYWGLKDQEITEEIKIMDEALRKAVKVQEKVEWLVKEIFPDGDFENIIKETQHYETRPKDQS